MSSGEIPLPALFARALTSGSRAMQLSAADDECQELVSSSLSDLRRLSARISSLGLFSPNETVDDLTTRDMVYLFVPYALSELVGRVRSTDHQERRELLRQSFAYLSQFSSALEQYEIVTEQDKVVWGRKASSDPTKRRETKIKQFKAEKEIRNLIEAASKSTRRPQARGDTDLDSILPLLPDELAPYDEDEDESLRGVTLLLLRLLWARCRNHIESVEQEMELLRHAQPPVPTQAPAPDQDTSWRLDSSPAHSGLLTSGPLMDSAGKPLRPFTILPSNAMSDRTRFQAEVFRPDHRLPTMTIDEYLEEERRRGNILSGGGPQSLEQPTTSEQLAIDSEMDGAVFGEEKSEQKRQKDEKWASFTDTHRKGEGNTMNRG